MKATNIIDQIFDESKGEDGRDIADEFVIQILSPTLLVNVGDIKAGTKVPCAVVDFSKGIVYITDIEGKILSEAAIKISLEPLTED